MSFNAATLLLPHPSLNHHHPRKRSTRPQRKLLKLALFRSDNIKRRLDVIVDQPPSLQPLQFPSEPIIDLTTCFDQWDSEKLENSTCTPNDDFNDDPSRKIQTTTKPNLQLPNSQHTMTHNTKNTFKRQKSLGTFASPVDSLAVPSTNYTTSSSSTAISMFPIKSSQSDCGHGYHQNLQKSSSLLRGFSLNVRSQDTSAKASSSNISHDLLAVSHSQSYLSPPSSWSRVGSTVSLCPSSSAEPSPTPSRNTSSSSISRWMFWKAPAISEKGKAKAEHEDQEEQVQTTWETFLVEDVKRSKVGRLSPPPPTPPAATHGLNPLSAHQISETNRDASQAALTSNFKPTNEIDLSRDSKPASKHHKTDGSISSMRTLSRALGHERSTSWGDAAAILLFGTTAEAIADRERERANLLGLLGEQVFGGSPDGMERRNDDGNQKTLLQSTPSQRRRAKFVLGGGESELDISDVDKAGSRGKPSVSRPRFTRRDAYVEAESEAEDVPVSDKDTTVMQRYRSVAEAIVDESLQDEELMRVVERLRKERLAHPGPYARSASNSTSTHLSRSATASSPEEQWEAIDDLRREIWEGLPVVGGLDHDEGLRESVRRSLSLQDGEYAPLRDSPQEFASQVDYAFNNDAKANPLNPNSPTSPTVISLSPSWSSSNMTSPSPSPTYQTALRALLITREILLTETNYIALLTQLLSSKTRTPPPALMLHYASDLLQVSKKFAEEMRGDVSVKGISRAFLKCEVELERALVRWCGVVGGWFVEGSQFEEHSSVEGTGSGSGRGKKHRRVSVKQASLVEDEVLESTQYDSHDRHNAPLVGNTSPLKRTVSAWRRSLPSMPVGLNQEGSHGIYNSARQRRVEEQEEGREREKERRKRPAVRDLAILPTQRVMRYVLLYQDLLSCTPKSLPTRPYVEKALASACRIAGRCDRAQENAAFVASSSSSSASTSRSNSNGSSSSAATSVTSARMSNADSSPSARAKLRFGSKRTSLMVSSTFAASSACSRSVSGENPDKKTRSSYPPPKPVYDIRRTASAAPRTSSSLIPSKVLSTGHP